MERKNYTEVLINGNIYTLGGSEEQEYLQKVAAYINADDYFKALQEAKMLKAQRDDLEREIYSLKHELISVQMKLDAQTEQ